MRHAALALALAFVATIGAVAPGPRVPVAAAASAPKVAIIVGAVHGQTDSYRQRGDAAYAEAIKWTPNVVKVFSPNATWTAVKAAVNGASIVIYMGHGNGWPSPYTYDPNYATKDGFGLNAAAGQGDNNTKYYGEPSIRTLTPAPNAVVLLHHLCYAAGNSEPGFAEPSLSVAKQRADNYASAFLAAGARAVIADGHSGPGYYLRALFSTRQTVQGMWAAAPNFHDNAFSFASARSPGYTVTMDPEQPTSRYYRAITTKPTLRTEDVTGATYAATDTHPPVFVVPGAASVKTAGAGVYTAPDLLPDATTGQPAATLALDTRVRLLAQAGTVNGAAAYQVRTLDGSITGYMSATNLTPRDSLGPQAWEIDDETGAFSPNDDGRQDEIRFSGRFSESVAWRMRVSDGSTVVSETTGSGPTFAASWDGLVGGSPLADGSYAWTLTATDGWGNPTLTKSGSVVVDTVAPALGPTAMSTATPAATLSPNGDGKSDTAALGFSTSEAGAIELTVRNTAAATVRTLSVSTAAGTGSLTWDGRGNSGAVVADGAYVASLAPRDLAGNVGAAHERTLWVYASLSKVLTSPTIFWPHDGDAYGTTSNLSFTLASAATVTWRVTTLDGKLVKSIKESTPQAAGTWTYAWNGRDAAGNLAPAGIYAVIVYAKANGVWASQKTWVELNAFSFSISDTTPARGQTITIQTKSAETLKSAPVLRVAQPGIAAWSVTMTKVSTNTYKATIKFKSSSTGLVSLRISGYDLANVWQRTYRDLPLS